MSDLGSIARMGGRTKAVSDLNGLHWGLRAIICSDRYMMLGGREETEVLSAASLRMDAKGIWRFNWVVTAGTRTISVSVKQAANASPRPQIIVRANSAIGVNADVTAVAGSSTGWISVSAIVSPTSAGVLEVELQARYDVQAYAAPCYWDSIVWT